MPKATGPVYRVPFRRRRDSLTNYAKRLALVKSGKPRMVVRKSLKRVSVQFMGFAGAGDEVIAAADSRELAGLGWVPRRNLPTAYLVGALAGRRAREKGVSGFVLDIGLGAASKGALPFAAAKGAVDAGLEGVPGEGKVDEARVSGAHVAKYAESIKGSPQYGKQFGAFVKAGGVPEKLPELFAAAKAKVLKGGA